MDAIAEITRQVNHLSPGSRAMASTNLAATAESVAARRRAGDGSPQLVAEALVLFCEAVRRSTGTWPAKAVVASAATAALGVVAPVRDDVDRTAAVAFAAYWRGIAGSSHLITVDDGRAGAARNLLAPVLELLGGSVGLLTEDFTREARQPAYTSTVTVGSYSHFAEDYLRDNLEYSRAEMVQAGGPRNAILDDADTALIDHALVQVRLTAPQHEGHNVGQAAERAVEQLQRGTDYRVYAEHDAVAFSPAALAHIKNAVGWEDVASMGAVTRAWLAECAILRRENLVADDERQLLADITVQGYIHTYRTVSGVASHASPIAPILDRAYGLRSSGLDKGRFSRAFGRSDAATGFDDDGFARERIVDDQRSWVYRMRATVVDEADAGRLIGALAADTVKHWSGGGAKTTLAGLDDVLAGHSTPQQINAVHEGPPPDTELADRAARLIEEVVQEHIGRLGPAEGLEFLRTVRLRVVDLQWGEHLNRVRFLQRHAQHEALRPLFSAFQRRVCEDSIKYILNVTQ
ncbi:MAG TPA: hypothetical protein VF062_21765 [Candidatus Limnocylindrales bacterium]